MVADRRACPVLDYLQKLMVMAQQVEHRRHRRIAAIPRYLSGLLH